MLEVTITHRFDATGEDRLTREEAVELRSRRWIGLGTEGYGEQWDLYPPGQHRSMADLFALVARSGAAIIAAYPGIRSDQQNLRLVGLVEPTQIQRLGRLICLPVSGGRVFDAHTSFLGNLEARRTTIQRCGNRARGNLARLAMGEHIERAFASIHHRDAEWIALNYLTGNERCATVWKGGAAFPGVDVVGWTREGGVLLAQVSISRDRAIVRAKSLRLSEAPSAAHRIVVAPAETSAACEGDVEFVSLETAFGYVDSTPAGRALIDCAIDPRPMEPAPF